MTISRVSVVQHPLGGWGVVLGYCTPTWGAGSGAGVFVHPLGGVLPLVSDYCLKLVTILLIVSDYLPRVSDYCLQSMTIAISP